MDAITWTIFAYLVASVISYSTMPATWIPVSALKTFDIVWANAYGNGTGFYEVSQVNNAIVPYPAGITFTYVPTLTMAITRYQANGDLRDTYVIFYRVNTITSTYFTLDHHVRTRAWAATFRCITLDPSFPHHLNFFSNIGVSSSVSISTTTYYPITANYTSLAISKGFARTTFSQIGAADYSQNVIIIFISCLGYQGVNPSNPIFEITGKAISATHMRYDFTLGTNVNLIKLHVNMIIYDKGEIQSAGLFKMNYYHINFTDVTGGEYPVPLQYQSTSIMGWTDFRSSSVLHYMKFNLQLSNLTSPVGNDYSGITMKPPISYNLSNNTPVNKIGISLFYMQSLICTNSNYYLDAFNQLCIQCTIMPGCQFCTNSSVCTTCFSSYLMNGNGTCTMVIVPEFISIENSGCNQFTVKYRDDQLTSLAAAQSAIYFLNNGISVVSVSQISQGVFAVLAQYSRDFTDDEDILMMSGTKLVEIVQRPIEPLLNYIESQCKIKDSVNKVLLGYTGVSYFLLLTSVISGKIVGLELFGILQISYFSLAEHSFLNLYLSPLLGFKMFNGLNLPFLAQQTKVSKILKSMGVSSNFINNCNIMLLVFYSYLLVSSICYLIFKLLSRKNHLRRSTCALKKGMVTLVLFNIFNIAFATGVHWKYSSAQDQMYVLGSVVNVLTYVVIAAVIVSLQITQKKSWGQFKDKFKYCQSQLFIPLTIVYRISLGLFCALKNEYQYSIIIMLGLSLAFTLYVMINLPFNDYLQNYRTVLVQVTMMYILLTADYYRTMKSNTPMSVKGRIYAPAIIELVLMALCIVVSMGVLARESYKMVSECFVKNKKINPEDQTKQEIKEEAGNEDININRGDDDIVANPDASMMKITPTEQNIPMQKQ